MELKKQLGFWDVFSIASGAMISSGIFILPGIAFSKAGPSVIISYFLGGIIAFLGILSLIELVTAMPKAGGDYFFVTRSMGPVFGTISGTLSWFSLSLKTAFAIFGIAEVVNSLFFGSYSQINIIIIGLIVTALFLALNAVGADFASKFETVIVFILLGIMIIYVVVGVFNVNLDNYMPFVKNYSHNGEKFILSEIFKTFSFGGMKTILTTTAFIFVSFGGLISAVSIAEEVKNPKKNLPKGIISSIISITILYALMLFVTVGNTDGNALANSLNPVANTAKNFLGVNGYRLITLGALLAFISTANAGIMSASRYPLALSRDGLYPEWISKINKRFLTPINAIILTGVFISLAIILPLDTLAKTASAVIFSTTIFTNIAIIILRESNVMNYKPSFKIPFYPATPILTIFLYYTFLNGLGFQPIFIMSLLILLALLIYFKYGKYNYHKEYAFQHLLLKMSEQVNLEHDLETELREILTSRDEIELDNFDRLVTNSIILDLEGPLTLLELFKIEAKRMHQKLGISKKDMIDLFKDREKQSTTAFTPFTAIPHIVVDNDDFFSLIVIRCKEGIYFSEDFNSVKAVFLFISSKNLRKEHLNTLASIANLVRGESFEEDWLSAKNENYLRDLILLSERERYTHSSKKSR